MATRRSRRTEQVERQERNDARAQEQHNLQAVQASQHRRAVRKLERRRHANERFPHVEPPGPGMIRIVADEPPSHVTVLLVSAPDLDGGVGGWEEIARDRRTPAIQHAGVPRATCTLECVMDRDVGGGDDVQDRVEKLYAMGRVDDTTGEPARIRLLGDVPAYNPLWVIDAVKPGDRLFTRHGRLRQQRLSITLSQWVDASLAVTQPAASTRSVRGRARARHYTTRQGDTLRRVALTQLGTQAQWKTILTDNRKLLKGVDPDALLRPGTRLRLTPPAEADKKNRKKKDD